MTTKAKQKAKQLFDKYCYAIRENEDDDGYFTNTIKAKRSANITIEEILNFIKESEIENKYWIKFWMEVKEEIEKL